MQIALPTVALLVPGYRVYRMSRAAKVPPTSPPPVRATKAKRSTQPQRTTTRARHITSTSLATSHPPPPRRAFTPSDSPPPPRAPSRISLPSHSALAAKTQIHAKERNPEEEEELDAAALEAAKDPLYAAGAFGIATLLVGLGLFVGVWGAKTVLGVENVREPPKGLSVVLRKLNRRPL